MTTSKVSLRSIISPAFYEIHKAIKKNEKSEYVLDGGRGSTKSSFASIEAVIQLVKHPMMHAIIMRKVGNTIQTSVFNQYVWAVDILGLSDKFKATKSPPRLTYLKTGQQIMFFGMDDPMKLKSLKVPFGYVGIIHFEELDQFSGGEEIRNVEQSLLRGGEIFYNFKTFNPPISQNNWANEYILTPKPGMLVHHSTYKTTPKDWLGKKFLDEAEFLMQTNERAYRHEYLGIPTGTGGNVFENLEIRKIENNELESFDRRYAGADWGWYPDPTTYNNVYFNAPRRELYVFDEIRCYKTKSKDFEKLMLKKNIKKTDRITADKELRTIADFRSWGWNMRSAEKGPGSVEYSMKWLQSLSKIIIDPIRCPETKKEFLEYEYERTRTGEIISGYPDKDNHHIDAVRYATEEIWRRSGK